MDLHRIWHLLGRKLAGEANLQELRELEQLLEKMPDEAYRIDICTEYLNKTSSQEKVQPQIEIDAAWQNHLKSMQEKTATDGAFQAVQQTGYRSQIQWLIAASVLVMMIAAGWIFLSKPFSHNKSVAENLNNKVFTQPGSRSKLLLPDGTTVWLNSDSRITYNEEFGKEKREVELVGEAFFDVAHNAKVPMVVHARSVNIVVKGTAFNVKAYPNEKKVETSLLRGLVELSTRSDPERKILLRPKEKITIRVTEEHPEQTKQIRPDKTKIKLYQLESLKAEATSNLIPEVSWTQNKLVFDNESFSEVTKKMERWYNVKIDIKDQQLAERKLTGVFEKENLEQALKVLQLLGRFRYEIKEDIVLIYKK